MGMLKTAALLLAAFAATILLHAKDDAPAASAGTQRKCPNRTESGNAKAERRPPMSVTEINKALATKISVNWKSFPLRKALDDLRDRSKVTFHIDRSLREAGMATNPRITFRQKNGPIRNVLQRVIRESLKLEWVIEDFMVKIVTKERAKEIEALRHHKDGVQVPHNANAANPLVRSGRSGSAKAASIRSEIRKQVEDVLRSQNGLSASYYYGELFKRTRPEDLRALQAGPHDGIALQIAWKDVVRRTFDADPKERRNTGYKLDRRTLTRFIGYVEGRLRVNVPTWWEKTALRARAWNRESFRFDAAKHRRYRKSSVGLYTPNGMALEKKGDRLFLRVGTESVKLPKIAPEDMSCIGPSIDAVLGPRRWFLAVHSSFGGAFELFCIDRKSGKVAWKKSVWADDAVTCRSGVFRSGERPGTHAVSITVQGDRVVVFGADGTSLFVEGFRTDDGANLFRFGATY